MPFPAGVGTCIVTGTYLDGQGNPLAGAVEFFFPAFELIDATDHVIISPGSITAVLNANGSFSVALPFTDNTAVNPSGWSYQVMERIPGPARAYFIQLPRSTGSTVDISTLVPASGASNPVWANAPFGLLAGNNTWAGTNAFGAAVTVPAPTAAANPTTKAYVDAAVIGADRGAQMLGLVAQPWPVQLVDHVDLGGSTGFLLCSLVRPGAVTITNLGLWLGAAGVTPNGVNAMALYDTSGNLLANTGDMSTALSNAANDNAYVEAALTATYAAAANTDYYIALLCHMNTAPAIGGFLAAPSTVSIPTIKGNRPSIQVSGEGTLPASFSVSGAAASVATYWLVAS